MELVYVTIFTPTTNSWLVSMCENSLFLCVTGLVPSFSSLVTTAPSHGVSNATESTANAGVGLLYRLPLLQVQVSA